jgi:hypothetical protein
LPNESGQEVCPEGSACCPMCGAGAGYFMSPSFDQIRKEERERDVGMLGLNLNSNKIFKVVGYVKMVLV